MKRWLLVVVCSLVLFAFGCESESKPAGGAADSAAEETEGGAEDTGAADEDAQDDAGTN